MKLSAPIPLRNKLPNTWKRLVKFLNFRLKKPLFIRALIKSRGSKYEPSTPRRRRRKRVNLISNLQCFKSSRDKENVMKLQKKSFSDDAAGGYSIKEPFPSPLTPAYVRLTSIAMSSDEQEMMMMEDAMKRFDKYLFEMVVEDGKLTNLEDVEELLFCWKSLKCPVFSGLVCRFYAELCNDLFSNANQDG